MWAIPISRADVITRASLWTYGALHSVTVCHIRSRDLAVTIITIKVTSAGRALPRKY
jgi:hypothetical protein